MGRLGVIPVTYAADTGQRYILVVHAHRTLEINNMASVCYNTVEFH